MGNGQGGPRAALRLCHSPASSTPRRSQGAGEGVFLGKENLDAFFGWLDYLDELVTGAHPVSSAPPAVQSRAATNLPHGSASAVTRRPWQMPSPRPWMRSFSRASCSHGSCRCECPRHQRADGESFSLKKPLGDGTVWFPLPAAPFSYNRIVE